MKRLNRQGRFAQVAQIEHIAGKLDGHIIKLSSLVNDLIVRQRVHMRDWVFELMLDCVASLRQHSIARSLSGYVLPDVTFSSPASHT